MILFVFEGERREPDIFAAMKNLFFDSIKDVIVCSYGCNIHSLYNELCDLGDGGDIVDLLKAKDHQLDDKRSSDFAEIYLFFDYDIHDMKKDVQTLNNHIREMIEMFDDETNNGKLYINYPMVESLRYTKKLPDGNFYKYVVSRVDCKIFKKLSNDFREYGNDDFFLKSDKPDTRKNWILLRNQNVMKANFICNGSNSMPLNKNDVSQSKIFSSQLSKFVCKKDCIISILNAFSLFLYEYFKE